MLNAQARTCMRGWGVVTLAVVLFGCWQVREGFEKADGGLGLEQQWEQFTTFGPPDNLWTVVGGQATRSYSNGGTTNSEVVALAEQVPETGTQTVTAVVRALDYTSESPDDFTWVSTGVLARASATAGEGGVAVDFSAYNGELVLTTMFGAPQYVLILWEANDFDYEAASGSHSVDILGSQVIGGSIDFPVALSIRAVDDRLTATATQADGTETVVTAEDSTLTAGRVGVISSLVSGGTAAVEIDDFRASGPSASPDTSEP